MFICLCKYIFFSNSMFDIADYTFINYNTYFGLPKTRKRL